MRERKKREGRIARLKERRKEREKEVGFPEPQEM